MSAAPKTALKPVRVLILGSGNMGNHHARYFAAIKGVKLAGAVDVDAARVEAFRAGHNIPRAFTTLDAAVAWGEFDAVANVTPDAEHHATAMKVIAAGKHILGEKPLATNHADALEMTEAAEKAGLVAMVNLSYRNVAELHGARALVDSGALGDIKHIEASYLQSWLVADSWGDWRTEPTWLWRLSTKHGSHGALGDIGIHILDFAVYGAAMDISKVFCRLQTFGKAPDNRIGEYPLDANDSFTMSLEFGNGALGVVHASRWATGYLNSLRLRAFGDKGAVEVNHGHDGSSLRACTGEDVHTQTWREVPVKPVPTNYERFIDAVRAGETREPSFRHATRLQRVLDLGTVSDGDRREHSLG